MFVGIWLRYIATTRISLWYHVSILQQHNSRIATILLRCNYLFLQHHKVVAIPRYGNNHYRCNNKYCNDSGRCSMWLLQQFSALQQMARMATALLFVAIPYCNAVLRNDQILFRNAFWASRLTPIATNWPILQRFLGVATGEKRCSGTWEDVEDASWLWCGV